LNLEGYKVLGEGELKEKISIKANSFSKSAEKKITSSGGKAIVIGKKQDES
jgi:large subunit ribosomal protein L15